MEILDLLGKISLFALLARENLAEIAQIVRLKRFPKGAILFEKGEEGCELLLVTQGRVKISILYEDGRELTLVFLSPFQAFGEMALLDDLPRSASASAVEYLEVLSIHKNDFHHLLEKHPKISLALLKQLSARLRGLSEDVSDLAFMDVYRRVARKILTLAETEGVPNGSMLQISQRLTHQELANMVGATRETVAKILKELEHQGFIALRRANIGVADPGALARIVGE